MSPLHTATWGGAQQRAAADGRRRTRLSADVSSQNMSAWRRKALELFPDLRSDIEDPDSSVMGLFFDLLPRCRDAHDRNDSDELKKIYGFAEWCASQKAKELWNAAGVGFYEHLADSAKTLDAIPLWLSKQVFEDIAAPLEKRVGMERVAKLRRRYR